MLKPIHEAPPFPPLVWSDHDGWEGDALLAAYGTTTVQIASADPSIPPTAAQARAFTRLVEQNEAVDDAVMRAILAEYPAYRKLYQEYDPHTADQVAPLVSTADELERLIDLDAVYVLDVEKDGEAYIGFNFGWRWDREHGLGVMTHAGRVVEVGQADTAFSWPREVWEARATPRVPAQPSRVSPAPKAKQPPRRWWEFWRRG